MAIPENGNGTSLDLQVAEKAYGRGDYQLSGHTVMQLLARNPYDIEALLLMSKILIDTEKSPLALAVAEKLTALAPDDWRCWLVRGTCEASLIDKAPVDSMLRAEELAPDNPSVLRSIAFAHAVNYRFKEAEEYARKAIPLEEHPQGHVALGFACLHTQRYGEGWDAYAKGMGHQAFREKQSYGLPDWEGQKGRLLVYAEQGLGDQIAFCTTLKSANVKQLVCHPKLVDVFKAAFPRIEVYGGQFQKEIEWKVDADYQCSMSELQRFYRRSVKDFPGTPYLAPHPAKRFQWAALLRSLGKRPKIGVAWTGGTPGAHGWFSRNVQLEDWRPIFESVDADFISLEYKERDTKGFPIHDFPWGTQTDNYEDTIALIDCLDAVVCVPTTAYHAAGALGVPAIVAVHSTPHWHEQTPWYKSVQFLGRHDNYINDIIERLRKCVFLSESIRALRSPITSSSGR
jgi:tetratricopeptide (TPR) repeat protein